MSKKKSKIKGFSIGEVMIAMFILITGIIAAVFLAAKSTAQIGDSRNSIIAMSLAQEGVELVRNVRDNSVTQKTCGSGNDRCKAFEAYAGNPPIIPKGLSYGWPSSVSPNPCAIDHNMSGTLNKLNCQNPEYRLYLNPSTGFYEHSHGGALDDSDFRFTRRIFVDYFNVEGGSVDLESDTAAAIITSVVTWEEDITLDLSSVEMVEQNCKINKQCAYAQTTLTSWLNYD